MHPYCKMHYERFSFKPVKGFCNTAQISLANIYILAARPLSRLTKKYLVNRSLLCTLTAKCTVKDFLSNLLKVSVNLDFRF